jgi:hypothetical protein
VFSAANPRRKRCSPGRPVCGLGQLPERRIQGDAVRSELQYCRDHGLEGWVHLLAVEESRGALARGDFGDAVAIADALLAEAQAWLVSPRLLPGGDQDRPLGMRVPRLCANQCAIKHDQPSKTPRVWTITHNAHHRDGLFDRRRLGRGIARPYFVVDDHR